MTRILANRLTVSQSKCGDRLLRSSATRPRRGFWINASYRVRVLQDPQKIFGDGDRAYLVANNALKAKVTPEVLARLARIKLSVAAVTEMDRMVNVENVAPREAARRWIALNREATRDWFPESD